MVAQAVWPDEHADLLLAIAAGVPAWMKDATCAEPGYQGDWWFPSGQGSGWKVREATAVCRTCLCQSDCLAYALDAGPLLEGVWGGSTEQERKQLIKRGVTGDLVRRSGSAVGAGRELVADEAAFDAWGAMLDAISADDLS